MSSPPSSPYTKPHRVVCFACAQEWAMFSHPDAPGPWLCNDCGRVLHEVPITEAQRAAIWAEYVAADPGALERVRAADPDATTDGPKLIISDLTLRSGSNTRTPLDGLGVGVDSDVYLLNVAIEGFFGGAMVRPGGRLTATDSRFAGNQFGVWNEGKYRGKRNRFT